MMSPLSVSQYIDPEKMKFDLVIMDEASQIRPEDAIGAVARGKQIIVVGDSQQLPPTSFFANLIDSNSDESDSDAELEENKSVEGIESILDMAQCALPHRYLKWHYRSMHESLIGYSNRYFYSDRLNVFPSPKSPNSEIGLRRIYLENARYSEGENAAEAEEVLQILVQLFHSKECRSIGIATMNKKQQSLIQRIVDQHCKTDPEFNKFILGTEDSDEPVFIKNLENVQGDERDIIIVSTTYGPDLATQKVYQRFGPINSQGGSRRLNVVFSRARQQMFVVTSLVSKQIIAGVESPDGVKAFRQFLEYSEQGGRLPAVGTDTMKGTDSVFEDEVIGILEKHGFHCVPQVGVSGFYIDIGVKESPLDESFIIGIECDGATYHSHPSIRDRDRIRQEILESKGWIIHRIWSTKWFRNRSSEIEALLSAIDKAKNAIQQPKQNAT